VDFLISFLGEAGTSARLSNTDRDAVPEVFAERHETNALSKKEAINTRFKTTEPAANIL
jgi:hypothetical protein